MTEETKRGRPPLGEKRREQLTLYLDTKTISILDKWSEKTRGLGDTIDRITDHATLTGFKPKQ